MRIGERSFGYRMPTNWKIYLLAVVSFLLGTSEYMIAGILDMIAEDVGVSVAAAGQLITVFSLAYGFGTPFLMAATARMDRRQLLVVSLAAFVVGNAIAVMLPGFASLVVSRIVLALSVGVFVVASMTVASNIAPPERKGSAIATVVMGFSAALVVGVPLGRVVASAYDWRMTFAGLGVLALLAIIAVAMTLPSTGGEQPVPLRQQLALLRQPTIVVALAITFFWIGGYSIAYTYISPFLLQVTRMSEQWISAGLFAFGIASLIGTKLGGFGADRWGVPRTLIGGLTVHAVALLLLAMVAPFPAAVIPLLMVWSFSAWSTGPTQQYNLLSLAPEASGIMLSLNSSVLQLGMAVGAGIGGVVVERLSLASITWLGAAAVAAAAIMAAISLGLNRSRELAACRREEIEFQKAGT
jgi:DHA1 family putative efflux transporter-like MFS transporter